MGAPKTCCGACEVMYVADPPAITTKLSPSFGKKKVRQRRFKGRTLSSARYYFTRSVISTCATVALTQPAVSVGRTQIRI